RSGEVACYNTVMNIYVQMASFNLIETEQLVLRPFSMSDDKDMFAYASQADNLVYVFPAHKDIAETRLAIALLFMKAPLGKWAIENKSDQKMIGTLTFVKIDEKQRTAEIGYVLNQDYWGKGLMTEAVRTLTDISLTAFGLNYVDIVVDSENLGSIKVAEKAGFRIADSYKALSPYTKVLRNFRRYRKGKHE
ncbi:MAG: GNAT family N-acetyltransferase, partial [Lactococcus sp.]|nr:GNAT family N-acetyltransferase [Lactococcus sp.]